MIEIFSHDTSFGPDEDAEDVFIISGKGWEEEPFQLYMTKKDVKNLLWQMTYYVVGSEASVVKPSEIGDDDII